MRGFNYKSSYLRESYSRGTQCIFISHQKNDSSAAKKIADYLMKAGINVYFDEYDSTLDLDDANSIVNGIKDGLNHSTHLLVLLSPNALNSKWVPWEIGYAYSDSSKKILSLTLKEVAESELPEYLKTTEIIRGTKSLNSLISRLLNRSESTLIYEQKMFNANMTAHPLDSVLNWRL